MKERGVEGFVHGNRGKKPWNKTALEKLEKAIKYKGRIYALLLARLFSFGLPWTRVYIAGQTRISNCDVLFS
jgi:hypothetical protein